MNNNKWFRTSQKENPCFIDARYKVHGFPEGSSTLKKQLKIEIGHILYIRLILQSTSKVDRIYAPTLYVRNEDTGLEKINATLATLSNMLDGYILERM